MTCQKTDKHWQGLGHFLRSLFPSPNDSWIDIRLHLFIFYSKYRHNYYIFSLSLFRPHVGSKGQYCLKSEDVGLLQQRKTSILVTFDLIIGRDALVRQNSTFRACTVATAALVHYRSWEEREGRKERKLPSLSDVRLGMLVTFGRVRCQTCLPLAVWEEGQISLRCEVWMLVRYGEVGARHAFHWPFERKGRSLSDVRFGC